MLTVLKSSKCFIEQNFKTFLRYLDAYFELILSHKKYSQWFVFIKINY